MGSSQEQWALSASQVRQFRKLGWLKISDVVCAADLELIRLAILQGEHKEMTGWVGQVGSDDESRKTFAHQQSPRWREMFRNETDLRLVFHELQPIIAKLGSIARDLLGRNDIRILYDQTFTKPPIQEGSRETPWHQDLPYLPLDRRGFMTFWIPIADVPEELGALRFVPGSKHLGPLGRNDLVGNPRTLDQMLTLEDRTFVDEPVCVPLRQGEFTVHDGLTLHGAGPNLGHEPRRAWTVQMIPADTLYTGAPLPLQRLTQLGIATFSPFDHHSLNVPSPGAPTEIPPLS
jgi:hypothetical protein